MCCESIKQEDSSELEHQEGFPGEEADLKGEKDGEVSPDWILSSGRRSGPGQELGHWDLRGENRGA